MESTLQERKDVFQLFFKLLVDRNHYDNIYIKTFLQSDLEFEDFTKV